MDADVIVVGGGLAGLVATAELADAGRRVILLDQETEASLGGQAFWSFGGLFFVNSPEQRRVGVKDSPELALQDWLGSAGFDRPEDAWPRKWAEAYVEFAADQDGGAVTQHPPRISCLHLGCIHHGVDVRIVHGDELSVDFNRVRYPDAIGFQHMGKRGGDGGLAGATGSIEEDGSAGVQGRSQLVQGAVVQHQMLKCPLHFGPVNLSVTDALRLHLLHVAVE